MVLFAKGSTLVTSLFEKLKILTTFVLLNQI